MIRPAAPSDGEAFAAIYNHYIRTSIATFEEAEVSGDEMRTRLGKILAAGLPWLVAEEAGRVVGYAYAGLWQERSAYRFSVASTVYLAPDSGGKGLGTALYGRLFEILKSTKVHVVVGGISLPNPASVALHEKFGMKPVAHFREVGWKFDQWIDVGYWQVTL